MATADSQPTDRYALVSSLYGPGTMAGWYLATLSVLVSWTLHPRKRSSGSIDVDTIAMLTLPLVAAAHLVSQVRGFLCPDFSPPIGEAVAWKHVQTVSAIEASFNVVETFMALSYVLFLISAWMSCQRRAILVGLMGLFCFAVECYVHLSRFMKFQFRYQRPDYYERTTFSQLFVADVVSLAVAMLVILCPCALLSSGIAVYMNFPPKQSPEPEATPRADTTDGSGLSKKELYLSVLTVVTTVFMLVALALSPLPAFWHSTNRYAVMLASTSPWGAAGHVFSRFAQNVFPRTAYSITDLDQAVAAAAGATALGFSTYNAAKASYGIWMVRGAPDRQTSGTELRSWIRPAS